MKTIPAFILLSLNIFAQINNDWELYWTNQPKQTTNKKITIALPKEDVKRGDLLIMFVCKKATSLYIIEPGEWVELQSEKNNSFYGIYYKVSNGDFESGNWEGVGDFVTLIYRNPKKQQAIIDTFGYTKLDISPLIGQILKIMEGGILVGE